jgi:hypothetical protein
MSGRPRHGRHSRRNADQPAPSMGLLGRTRRFPRDGMPAAPVRNPVDAGTAQTEPQRCAVQLLAVGPQQRFIGGVANQGVFEPVGSGRRNTAAPHEPERISCRKAECSSAPSLAASAVSILWGKLQPIADAILATSRAAVHSRSRRATRGSWSDIGMATIIAAPPFAPATA